MRNVITNGLPSTVMVGGEAVEINTNFRHCLQASMLVDGPDLDGEQKALALVFHLFGKSFESYDMQDCLNAARSFLKLDELDTRITRRGRRSTARTFDWDEDQKRLVADFWREYRIDLTDQDMYLHWWLFLTLFEGLSADSATMTAIGIRAREIPKGASDAERAHLRELKKQFELAPRSREEHEARDRAIWGD